MTNTVRILSLAFALIGLTACEGGGAATDASTSKVAAVQSQSQASTTPCSDAGVAGNWVNNGFNTNGTTGQDIMVIAPDCKITSTYCNTFYQGQAEIQVPVTVPLNQSGLTARFMSPNVANGQCLAQLGTSDCGIYRFMNSGNQYLQFNCQSPHTRTPAVVNYLKF